MHWQRLRPCPSRFPKEARCTFRREVTVGFATPDHTVPYETVPLGWRCPRHFVPGYDRTVSPGQEDSDAAKHLHLKSPWGASNSSVDHRLVLSVDKLDRR